MSEVLDFQAFVERDQARVRGQAAQALTPEPQNKPDNVARAMQLGTVTGVDPALILPNLEDFEQQQRVLTADQIITGNPALQGYVRSNPLAAQASSDDWGALDKATQSIAKLPLPVPGMLGGTVGGATSVFGKAIEGFKHAFDAERQGTEYAKLGEYLAQTPGFGNIFIRHATQAAAGLGAGALYGLGGLVAGVSAGVGQLAQNLGMPEAWANRLTRDVYAGLNVAMPELAMGSGALTATARAFSERVGPYLEAGKTPPPGVHPIMDAIHAEQATADLAALQEALRDSVASATRERTANLYADIVRQITDGEIGVSADAIRALYGDKVPTLDDGLLGWVPRIQDQLRAAEATGGYVQVPIADWLAKIDPAVAKQLEEYVRVRADGVSVAEAKAGFEAWHGSPHEFEAFANEAIGTGEGAQSYGHGHYVAQNPGVATEYKDRLSAPKYNRLVELERKIENDPQITPAEVGEYRALQKEFDQGSAGNLYKVRIRRDPAEFLDWDRPLSEQPEHVRNSLKPLIEEMKADTEGVWAGGLDNINWDRITGREFRDLLDEYYDSRSGEMTSKSLAAYGIPGIKYLDQGSRQVPATAVTLEGENFVVGKGTPQERAFKNSEEAYAYAETIWPKTSNFVIFDPADIEIITRNGEAIRAAREAAGLRPLLPVDPVIKAAVGEAQGPTLPLDQREAFTKAAAVGMTMDQYARWMKAVEAQAAGDSAAIAKRVLEAEKRRQSADWREKREAMRGEVVDEIRADPAFAADRLLREGRFMDQDLGRVRIDSAELTPEQRAALPKQYMAKDGLSLDVLAEMVGLPDGKAFLAAVEEQIAARRQSGMRVEDFNRTLVNAELDRRMEARYGNLDQSIIDMAQERVLAETQIQILHEEILALATKAGLEFSITPEQLRAALRAEFDGLGVKGLKADNFLADAGRAGKASEMALLKGDAQEGFRQKQRQYNAIVMARFAKEFEGAMAALDKRAKAYNHRDIPKVDPATRYYIQGLLQEAGYPTKMLPEEIATEIGAYGHGTLGDFATLKAADGYEPEVANWIMNPKGSNEGWLRPLEEMTTREAMEFKEAIDTLDFIGRDIQKVELLGEKRDFEAWKVNEVLPNLRERPIRPPNEARWFYAVDAMMARPEELIRALDLRKELGPLFRAVIAPLELSKAKSYAYLNDLAAKLRGLDKSLGDGWYKTLTEIIPNDFIFDNHYEGMFNLTRWNMVKMMLNWGNVQNAGKLVDGIARAMLPPGVKPAAEHLAMVEGKIQAMFDAHAKPEDWLFVKSMWEMFAAYKDDIATLQRNTSGKPPKWVEGRKVMTPHGEIDGAYFPLIRDKARNVGLPSEIPTIDGLMGKDYYRATTSKHHLDERTGARYFVDIDNGPEQLIGRLQQVIHDLSFRDSVMQVNKVINDPQIAAAIKKHYGEEYYKQFKPWLERVARMNNVDEAWLSGASSVMGRFRLNLTMAALPGNPTVMFTPSLGTARYLPRILLEKFASNFGHTAYERDKAVAMTHSKEIPNLLFTLDRDAADAMAQIAGQSKYTSFQKHAMQWFYKPLVAMEKKTRLATWTGEFEAQIEKGRSEHEAATWADSIVRQRHGTAHFVDMSNLMASKNEFVRVPTMFMSYFSTIQNWLRETPDLVRQGRYKDMATVLWGVFGVAAIYNYTFFQRPRENEPWYVHLAKSVGSTPFAMVPYVRDIYGYYTEGFQPKTPLVSWMMSVGNVVRDGYQITQGKRPKRPVRNVAESVGQTFGVPGALQAGRLGEFAYDLKTGEQRPKDIFEWGRGVLWGESKLRK